MLLFPPIEKLGSIPVWRRTPEDRKKDIDLVVKMMCLQDRSRRIAPVTLKLHWIQDLKCPGLGP